MGRQALITALTWLTLSGTLAKTNIVLQDSISEESAQRLYRNVPTAVYAAPYGAYSFQVPVSIQKTAASRIVPSKESPHQNTNGYLKDSYGNRFVESLKAIPLKPFPQQYVQLQELPAHFTQPLAAAPQAIQYKQVPQIIVGSHYRLPLQAASQTQKNQFGFAHPGVYAESFKNLAPSSILGNSYSPQVYGPVIQVPTYLATATNGPTSQLSQNHEYQGPASQPNRGTSGQEYQNYSHSVPQTHEQPNAQQQSTSNKAVYANTHNQEHHHQIKNEPKFQRLQEASHEETYSEEKPSAPSRQVVQNEISNVKAAPIKHTKITTVVNGQKTVVNLETNPPVPLLDITLLEPLTFDNPLVPQVQHFLPRINEATYVKLPERSANGDKKYQKEFVVQKTKSYDSGTIKGKPKKVAPKKKNKSPPENTYNDELIPQAPVRPTVTIKGTNDNPEFSYEINSPNYKETYKEHAVKYNKETESEPVHYTYGTNTHKEPVHYSYSHSSKEPVHIQEVRYEGKGEGPKHLIYKFKPEEQNRESETPQSESEESGESSEHSDDDAPTRTHHGEHREHHDEAPKSYHHHHESKQTNHHHHHHAPKQSHHQSHHEPKPTHNYYNHETKKTQHQAPEHREQEYHYQPSSDANRNVHHNVHSNQQAQPIVLNYPLDVSLQPVAQYEEDIQLTAPIKVDPNQHTQQEQSEPQRQPRPSPTPQYHSHPSPAPQQHTTYEPKHHHEPPSTHVQEKTKQVYIHEETPEDEHSVGEQLIKAMFGHEEEKEKDFEKAYKHAALGFPAYHRSSEDAEKDIYNPENYGIPRDDYHTDHSPFQQYHESGDDFPKESRHSYKNDRDNMKEDYFLDYSVARPESLTDLYKNKVNYYKLYKQQRPEKYVARENEEKKKQNENEKFKAIPYNSFYPVSNQQMKQLLSQYKAEPLFFEYDYSKGPPTKDSSAHASRPFQRLKMKTHFVEPQFQYGFEPIAIPHLLDSELATMASNNRPESEKPGMRKKIYKENFYIKKTSMSDAGPNS